MSCSTGTHHSCYLVLVSTTHDADLFVPSLVTTFGLRGSRGIPVSSPLYILHGSAIKLWFVEQCVIFTYLHRVCTTEPNSSHAVTFP